MQLITRPAVNCRMKTHSEATTRPLHLLSFRGELNSRAEPASPDSAIVMRALALNRSTAIYNRYVNNGIEAKLGRREKRGKSSGA